MMILAAGNACPAILLFRAVQGHYIVFKFHLFMLVLRLPVSAEPILIQGRTKPIKAFISRLSRAIGSCCQLSGSCPVRAKAYLLHLQSVVVAANQRSLHVHCKKGLIQQDTSIQAPALHLSACSDIMKGCAELPWLPS